MVSKKWKTIYNPRKLCQPTNTRDWGDITKGLMSLLLQRLWQCLHTINFIINHKTKWAHGKVCDKARTTNEGTFAFTDKDEIIYNNGVL